MASSLYINLPAFSSLVDSYLEIYQPLFSFDLKSYFKGTDLGDLSEEKLVSKKNKIEILQYLSPTKIWNQCHLFVVSISMARLLIDHFGVRPAAMVGHSLGEIAAATVAGVFETRAALNLVFQRACLIRKMEDGLMLSVKLSLDQTRQILNELSLDSIVSLINPIINAKEIFFYKSYISVAASNSPTQTVLAGSKTSFSELVS